MLVQPKASVHAPAGHICYNLEGKSWERIYGELQSRPELASVASSTSSCDAIQLCALCVDATQTGSSHVADLNSIWMLYSMPLVPSRT
jgi:hypothetical protein